MKTIFSGTKTDRNGESRQGQRGAALILSLLVVVVLMIFGGMFVLRSVHEWNESSGEVRLTEASSLAEAGVEDGFHQMNELINSYMYDTVNDTPPGKVGNDAKKYVQNQDGLGLLVAYVKNGGAVQLTLDGDTATYDQAATDLGDGTYSFNIAITEKTVDGGVVAEQRAGLEDVWDFFFNYKIRATGRVDAISQKVLLLGDFTVTVKRENFAKYALFTDHHQMKPEDGGYNVWFTDKTNFAGPLHTNDRYNFARDPAGTFEDEVKQHLTQARFYNNGSPILRNADDNDPYDIPVFHSTFTRGEDEVVLESSVQKADLYSQARADDDSTGDGIFIANNGTSLTGGIYIHGNSGVEMSVDGNDNAVYTITQGATTKIVTVDIPNNQTTVETQGVGTDTYQGLPDGLADLGTIIYADGEVSSLEGTVQRDSEVTVSAENDIVISGNVRYSDYTPATGQPGDAGYVPPSAEGTSNLLGIVSWGGDVRIGTTAPNNVDIHGIVMARNGVFQVDEYYNEGPRGTATLLGGVITQFYGAFGMFNGSTGEAVSGYGRNFVYDSRTRYEKSPPYFPTMKAYIASTPDITDNIVYREGDF